MKNAVKMLFTIIVCSSLFACGGSGGGSNSAKEPPVNQAPTVLAGDDQSITLPDNTVVLTANIKGNGSYSVLWTQVSGPVNTTFSAQSSSSTNAEFSKPGLYTLRVTANDSEFTVTDEVKITVSDIQNQAPVVVAGDDQIITLPVDTTNLDATVTDNDNDNYTVLWTQVSGPVGVTFADDTTVDTSVVFPESGTYTLRLTADDDEFVVNDEVTITVNNVVNKAPVVMAGDDQSIILSDDAINLTATVTDDDVYSVLWTKLSGPGHVDFTDDSTVNTSVSFDASGDYILRLTVDDGEFSVSDDILISVKAGVDSFGITKLYQTATGFTDWESTAWDNGVARTVYDRDYSDSTGWSQKRGDDVLEIDGNGVMEMGGGDQPRIYINPYSGSTEVDPDQFFKNVEATVYYKRIGDDGASNGGLVIGLRSGPNGHSSSGDYCDATTYYARFRHDGDWDFYKELKHTDGARANVASLYPGNLPTDQWIGMKFIAYNINNDSNVKLEVYVDKISNGDVTNGGEWTLVGEMVDDGNWSVPEDVSSCTYDSNHIITTGGGAALIRNTGVQSAEYKYFSVREIDTSID